MYISARTEENVADQLKPILGSALRNELGRRPFAALLSPERGQMMDEYQERAQPGRPPIWRGDRRRPDQARRPARRHAARIRLSADAHRAPAGGALDPAQGSKQAQIIRAEADAEAAAPMPAAFNQDPEFYDFYRAMQSYETSFVIAPARRNAARAGQHHPVAEQRISAAIPGQSLESGSDYSNPVQPRHLACRKRRSGRAAKIEVIGRIKHVRYVYGITGGHSPRRRRRDPEPQPARRADRAERAGHDPGRGAAAARR